MLNEDQAWVDYRKQFSEVYDASNYASPLQSFVMRVSHKLVERPFDENTRFGKVIEIGAGTGEHLPFVRHNFDQYVMTDLDPATLNIAKRKLSARSMAGEVLYEAQPSEGLRYEDSTFDRLIATHVLEHIYYPHLALKEWSRVVKNDGVLSILIPTDPGIAWRLGRHLGPRKQAMAQGIAYDYVMAREHVNGCNNLIALLRHYFPIARESWWPMPIASIDLNLFFAFTTRVVK